MDVSYNPAFRARKAAEYLGISPSHFWELVAEKRLPEGKLLSPRTRVWRLSELNEELENGFLPRPAETVTVNSKYRMKLSMLCVISTHREDCRARDRIAYLNDKIRYGRAVAGFDFDAD